MSSKLSIWIRHAAFIWPLLVLALAGLACSYPGLRPAIQLNATPGTSSASATKAGPMVSNSGSPTALPFFTQTAPVEVGAGKPAQSQSAEIRPPELRSSLTRISALTGMKVLDRDGAPLGTAADWVVNTCETYLVYFLLAPSSQIKAPSASQIVVPYEAVTINSGVLDARSKSIQLQLTASQLAGAPALPESQSLVPTDWEAGVRDFWQQRLRLSGLTTGCRVPAYGGTVEIYKAARASQILGTELRDGLNNVLGRVEEIIVEPESGKVSFFVISRISDSRLVLVPLRVLNIPNQALAPGGQFSLVLLVDSGLLKGAPQIGSIEAAGQPQAQAEARGYWGR